MATKSAPPRPAPRLYLATPVVDDPSALAAGLAGVLAEADVAAVLLRLQPTDPRTMITRVKALAPVVQNSGAALLLDGHVDLVARGGADGAHLTGIEAMADALTTLKPDRIAGVGGLTTRHDSMSAGEAGADYVLFGEPDARGQRPSAEAIAERLQWWAELFEPPCVGFAGSLEEAREFAAAGADFILVGDLIWTDSRGPAVALSEVEQAIGQAYAAAPATSRPNRDSAGMNILRPISILVTGLMLAASGASAQISLAPPGAEKPPAASKPTAKPKPKPREVVKETVKKPAAPKPEATPAAPAATVTPAPAPDDPNVDFVYAAYQRGQYKTASIWRPSVRRKKTTRRR